MKTPSVSFDQFRRLIRRELFQKRLLDNNHSEPRLYADARELDAILVANGYELLYPTEWSKHFDKKRHLKRLENSSIKPLQSSQTHFDCELILD